MRKTLAALLPLTLLLIAAASAVAGDFRAVDWGMSKAQVKAAESLEVMQEGGPS